MKNDILKSMGAILINFNKPERPEQLQYGSTLFKKEDIVRTIAVWYSKEEVKQGKIIGFSYFVFEGEQIPSVEIELDTGELYETHPSNIEKVDESWLEMC